jgi:hypothetical protein
VPGEEDNALPRKNLRREPEVAPYMPKIPVCRELGAKSHRSHVSAWRVYRGDRVERLTYEAIVAAAVELGLPLPPPRHY